MAVNHWGLFSHAEGVNFVDPNVRLDFTPTGATEQCIDVVILQDNVVTTNSQLFQLVPSTTDVQLALPQTTFVTITDSDGKIMW